MHRREQQHREALVLWRGEQQPGQLGILGDPGGEVGVQRRVARLGEVGELLLASADGVVVAE